jgi:hypothetical protein
MTKLLPTLALVLLASAGVAAPVLADDDFSSFDAGYQLTRLQDQGINAVDVSEAPGDQLRATVKLADGSTAFEFYDAASLNLIKSSQDGAEVTGSITPSGKAPVVHHTAPAQLNSLTEDSWDYNS